MSVKPFQCGLRIKDLPQISSLLKEAADVVQMLPADVFEDLKVRHWLGDELHGTHLMAADGLEPIPMILHCPKCHTQHIDAVECDDDMPDPPTSETPPCEVAERIAAWQAWEAKQWLNPPHRSHLCHDCGHIWRPADVPTTGVAAINTKGKNDS